MPLYQFTTRERLPQSEYDDCFEDRRDGSADSDEGLQFDEYEGQYGD